MPVLAADIKWKLSGGATNTNPNDSLGDPMSSSEIANATLENLFDTKTASEAAAGRTEYRCLYIHNNHATDSIAELTLWISTQTPAADTAVEIALASQGVGNGSTTGVPAPIANETTAPAGVTFSAPSDAGTGLVLGTLTAGQVHAVWVKLVVDAAAASTPLDNAILSLRGVN